MHVKVHILIYPALNLSLLDNHYSPEHNFKLIHPLSWPLINMLTLKPFQSWNTFIVLYKFYQLTFHFF